MASHGSRPVAAQYSTGWLPRHPPDLDAHREFMSAERLAVQRSGRRQAGAAILRRCLCGDQIRCNGIRRQNGASRTRPCSLGWSV
jgi:hypothetical protein